MHGDPRCWDMIQAEREMVEFLRNEEKRIKMEKQEEFFNGIDKKLNNINSLLNDVVLLVDRLIRKPDERND